jgi:hypothetical protein
MNATSAEHLHKSLLDWVRREGYPFELEVAGRFGAAGWRVELSQPFRDPESDTTREIDIIATFPILGRGSFSFAIECKTSREKPWVAFATDRRSFRGDENYDFAPWALASLALIFGSDEHWLQRDYDCAAVSISQAFRDRGIDNAYAAIQAARSAAIAINERNEECFPNAQEYALAHLHVVVPLVVLDGQLFLFHSSGEEQSLREVSMVQVPAWQRWMSHDHPLIVTIVTREGLDAFIGDSVRAVPTLLDHLDDEAKDQLANMVVGSVRGRGQIIGRIAKHW